MQRKERLAYDFIAIRCGGVIGGIKIMSRVGTVIAVSNKKAVRIAMIELCNACNGVLGHQ